MSEMRKRGIEPTADSLKVVTAAWALLIANTDQNEEDYEKALTDATQAGVNFAENSIASLEGVPMSLEEITKRGDYALSTLVTDLGLAGTELGILRKRAEESGVAIPEILKGLGDNESLKNWDNTVVGNAFVELSQAILVAEADSGTAVTLIDTAFKEIGFSAGNEIGANGTVATHTDEFGVLMEGMVIDADKATAAALNAMKQYALMQKAYSSGAYDSYYNLEGSEDIVKKSNFGSYNPFEDEDSNLQNAVAPAFDEQDLLGISNKGTIINVTVSNNTVNNDEELAKEIEGALTRGTNWAPVPSVGI